MDTNILVERDFNCKFYDSDEEWFKTLPANLNFLQIGFINIRSLPLHFENLNASLRYTTRNVDFLALSETYLNEEKL